MDTQLIHTIAVRHGVVPQAMQRIIETVMSHYPDKMPSASEIDQTLALIPLWERMGMSYETFHAMPPQWRSDQARKVAPPVTTPHAGRPVQRALTTEELASIEGLPLHEWHTRGRQMQETPVPEQP